MNSSRQPTGHRLRRRPLHVERLEDRCLLSHFGPQPDMRDDRLGVRPVVSGLITPTSIAFLGPGDMFVLEKNTGQVQHVVDGAIASTALDLAVNNASERGLLGIALHPDFPTNPLVYLYWTARTAAPPSDPFIPDVIRSPDIPEFGADTGDVLAVPLLGNRVDRFVWDGTSLVFDQNLIMLRAFQNDGAPLPAGQGDAGQVPAGNHNGGAITFGTDGKLYIVVGDVGRRGQLQNLPSGPTATGLGTTVPDDQFGGPEPDDAHFTSVIIRLNDDGTTPADNPFFAVGAALGGEAGDNIQRIFAYGIRNSFGIAVDPFTGRLWDTENGDNSFDELNLVLPGFNSGWLQVMGPLGRLARYKGIETTAGAQNLQQLRWSPDRIANSAAEAVDRLFELAGSQYSDPEFSWKLSVAPTSLDFVDSAALGGKYFGDLVVGNTDGQLMDFDLTPGRFTVKFKARELRDRVDDNSKFAANQSRRLIMGDGFGVISDVESGPGGKLYVTSLDQGAVYEVFRITARKFGTQATGAAQVPPRVTAAGVNVQLRLSKDGDELFVQVKATNLRNVVAVHLHLGAPGDSGPIVATLFADPPGGGKADELLVKRTLRARHLKGPLAGHSLDDLVGALLDGQIYADIHTDNGWGPSDTGPGDFASGELRGQLRARQS